jgi:hypothetical protein
VAAIVGQARAGVAQHPVGLVDALRAQLRIGLLVGAGVDVTIRMIARNLLAVGPLDRLRRRGRLDAKQRVVIELFEILHPLCPRAISSPAIIQELGQGRTRKGSSYSKAT